MEILNMILIGIVGLIVIVLALVIRNRTSNGGIVCRACDACPTRAPCQTCAPCPTSIYVTHDEVLDAYNVMKAINPTAANFANGMTYDDLKAALSSSNVYLPQDLPRLSPKTVSNLTELQINVLAIAFSALMAKGTFSLDQLAAMTPSQIALLSPFQLLMPSLLILSLPKDKVPLSNDQRLAFNSSIIDSFYSM
jgi:hypothetical protein